MMMQRLVMKTEKKKQKSQYYHTYSGYSCSSGVTEEPVLKTPRKKNTFNYIVSADALWLWSITDLWTETFDPDTVSGTVTACVMTVCILY